MGSHRVRHDWSDLAAAYTCFSAVLLNHPTFAFSQSPKVCSLHLCLLCCPACGIIDTVFLNSLCIALGILIPQSGIKPVPPALETCSLNHSTAREVLEYYFNIEFKFNIWITKLRVACMKQQNTRKISNCLPDWLYQLLVVNASICHLTPLSLFMFCLNGTYGMKYDYSFGLTFPDC